MLSINPDAATRHDVARMAAELMDALKERDAALEAVSQADALGVNGNWWHMKHALIIALAHEQAGRKG